MKARDGLMITGQTAVPSASHFLCPMYAHTCHVTDLGNWPGLAAHIDEATAGTRAYDRDSIERIGLAVSHTRGFWALEDTLQLRFAPR